MGPMPEGPRAVHGARYTDNVVRMHLFAKAHPEVSITLPGEPGGDFTATRDGEVILSDRSLGWLMDRLEGMFREGGRGDE